jgi:peptidoglycan/LPS O-acetylase OafA/YrhL
MQQPNRPLEIRALSGARALPPLILVLYHYCEGHGYRNAPWFDLPIGKGYLWVEFFFALSGFILVHVYGRKADAFRSGTAYWPFLQARLARLYPLHLFTLLSMVLLMWAMNGLADLGGYISIYHQPYPPINTWPSFFASLFMVQAWNLFPWLTWNGASWFVSVEFLLCILFPLYLLWARGGIARGVGILAVSLAALALLAFSDKQGLGLSFSGGWPQLAVPSPPQSVGLDLTFHNGVLRGMAGFGVGVGLAMLYREAKAAGVDRLPGWIFSVAQGGVLLLLLGVLYRTGWSHTPQDIWTALALFLLIFVLAFDRGFLAGALATAPMLKLGEWSYAIYMGQTFWLQLVRTLEQRVYPPGETVIFGHRFCDLLWWGEPILLLGVCILWGGALTKLVEQPANAALRQWFAAGGIGTVASHKK